MLYYPMTYYQGGFVEFQDSDDISVFRVLWSEIKKLMYRTVERVRRKYHGYRNI